MAANSFGNILRITTFGESHGLALGCVIDGLPSGLSLEVSQITRELERRRPGTWGSTINQFTSKRNEEDVPEILSGIFKGKSIGTPIAVLVRNSDSRSKDYDLISAAPRIGHADDVWKEKFKFTDHRGGGRASGRETVSRVIAGAISKMALYENIENFQIIAYLSKIGKFKLNINDEGTFLNKTSWREFPQDKFVARFPDSKQENDLSIFLDNLVAENDSIGAEIKLRIKGVPAGIGEPVFHKLKADLASAIMGIGAVTAVSLGEEFDISRTGKSVHVPDNQKFYGGIRGGISTGEEIVFSIVIKPTSSISDIAKHGRHDPCIAIRAVPVIESMAAIVILDHFLWSKSHNASLI